MKPVTIRVEKRIWTDLNKESVHREISFSIETVTQLVFRDDAAMAGCFYALARVCHLLNDTSDPVSDFLYDASGKWQDNVWPSLETWVAETFPNCWDFGVVHGRFNVDTNDEDAVAFKLTYPELFAEDDA